MNDLDLCLEVVSRSCQPLRYIQHWISRKPLEIEAWFQRTTNRKWPMGYQMVTWPMTSRDPHRWCEPVRSAILAIAWLLVRPCNTRISVRENKSFIDVHENASVGRVLFTVLMQTWWITAVVSAAYSVLHTCAFYHNDPCTLLVYQ